jgi:formylglycine-generating enzyme required for sulfatase activity/serine/threonine protein kinase
LRFGDASVMSDKPASKSTPVKPTAKSAGVGSGSATKASSDTPKSKPIGDHDDDLSFLAPPEAADEIGRLGKFRVLRVLGKGGMGTVFMAEDTRLHRIVALKVMLPSIAKKPIARDRFIREARATAAIEHDHIITIYEVCGDTEEVPYAAMQYLKGMTLDDWLRAGKTLNVPQIMRIGKEIAKGLAAAHARKLIHRDIKPSNIWLDAANKGRVKILDFGLARPTNEETHLTQEGMILGTPAYMSPEQARGQDVDERCDLFSLGCVLYRLCSGKLPFMGKDAMSMLLAITSEEPADLRSISTDMPADFTALVHKLLAKKPEDRPASAKDVVQAIQNIERDWIASGRTVSSQILKSRERPLSTAPETVALGKVEDVDPALEESAITELELQKSEPPHALEKPRSSSGAWIIAALVGALFAVLSIACCLGIAITTDHGNIDLVVKDDVATKLLADANLTVRDRDHHKSLPVALGINKIPAGDYKFDEATLPPGIHVEPNPFQLERGQTLEIMFRYQPAIVLITPDDAKKLQKDWSSFLKRPIDETNSVDATLTLIPPGEFYMGSSKDQLSMHKSEFTLAFKKGFDKKNPPPDFGYINRIQNETPQHRVRISKPFYFGTSEVTLGQFARFVAANPGHLTIPEVNKKGGTGLDNGKDVGRKPDFSWRNGGPGYNPTPTHPVTNITWKDAEEFCAWLSKKEGKTYRLPTEAEWEYACRAGSAHLWSFGDDHKDATAREYAWYTSPSKLAMNPPTPSEVQRKRANGFGLFDIHGNVWEMCSDVWGPAYYEQSVKDGLAIDPKGPAPGTAPGRVVRGGSFLDSIHLTRSAYRYFLDPSLGNVHVGFRVVCEVAE